MLFTNGTYFIFLIAVFFAFWLTKPKWRIALLLLANYCFYSLAGVKALALLLALSTIDFTIAKFIATSEAQRKRKLLLLLSIIADVGTLCFFKYANFFLASSISALHLVGYKITLPQLNFIVPLGLSFFIFQSLSYVIDVYRRTTEPAKNYWQYLTFVSFFPTIVAGPITRARQLLPQLKFNLPLTAEQGGQTLFLIAMGLIKKIAVADYLRANFVDRVFDFPERYSALEVLTAIYGYAIQIYADFSGYSDIAIGSALLLGIMLPLNFDAPYRAVSLPEFWRRWHITLSTWLRDYVFFSLTALNKRSATLMYAGLIITMLLGGLWHGAAWTFVSWGLLHGVGLAGYRGFEALRKRFSWHRSNTNLFAMIGVFLTFHFVCFTWVFFRAETLTQALAMLRSLASMTANTANLPAPIIVITISGFALQWLPYIWWEQLQKGFVYLPAPAQAILLAAVAIGLYFVASSDVVPFIYANF